MRLIVGLGNPGLEYARTRHNAGFMALDRLAQRQSIDFDTVARTRFHGLAIDVNLAGEKCLLIKPSTFMNRSGLCVGEAVAFHKLEPADVMIIVDDVALPMGSIRLRAEGSAGGHNGLTDIERALGTRVYPRLRVGIDAPGRVPQKDYVLGRFSPDQQLRLDFVLDKTCDALTAWVRDGLPKAMSLYNAEQDKKSGDA